MKAMSMTSKEATSSVRNVILVASSDLPASISPVLA